MQFTKTYCLNLARRKDRLETFRKHWDHLSNYEIVPAIDGKEIPYKYADGTGAMGCSFSWQYILCQAWTQKLDTILVLEDDAVPCKDYRNKLQTFLDLVPADWQALYLGGQNMAPPKPVNPFVDRTTNTQRTHAVILKMRGDFVKAWFKMIKENPRHIDHLAGTIQNRFPIYQPHPEFLVSQSESYSDITYAVEHKRSWNAAPPGLPIVLLKSNKQVRDALQDKLHFGYSIRDGIDIGLTLLMTDPKRQAKLKEWIQLVNGEAYTANKVLAVYHPGITPEMVKQAYNGPVIVIKDNNAETARLQIPDPHIIRGSH